MSHSAGNRKLNETFIQLTGAVACENTRMDPDADIEELFAPIEPAAAFGVVLNEAHDVLPHIREPVDAELWGSDMIGALAASAADTPNVMAALTTSLVPAAEETATPEALALLRIFGAIGSPELRAAATAAAERVTADGVPRPGLGGGHRLARGRPVLALQRRRRPAGVRDDDVRLR